MKLLIACVCGATLALLITGQIAPADNAPSERYQQSDNRVIHILEQQNRRLERMEEKLAEIATRESPRFIFMRVDGIRDLVRLDQAEGRISFYNNRTNIPFWGTPIIEERPLDPNSSFYREYTKDIENLYTDPQ